MAKRKRAAEPLGTIWRCPDELWTRIEPILAELDPPAKTGRPRIDPRRALDGVIHQMRTGGQWNQLPRTFGDDASVHRTFQRWVQRKVLERIWAVLVTCCDAMKGVQWRWQSADCSMGKARLGGALWGRTPRIAGKTAANAA